MSGSNSTRHWLNSSKAPPGGKGRSMKLRLWRGRLLLRLSILFDRWSWRAMTQAKLDFAKSARPEGDLFAEQEDWQRSK
jgi:hypothetical protein